MGIGYRNDSWSSVSKVLSAREVIKLEFFDDDGFRNYEGMMEEMCSNFGIDQDEFESNYDLSELEEDEDLQYKFVDDLINAIVEHNSNITKEDFNYALWLCDSKEDVLEYYADSNDEEVSAYYTSDVVLSDLDEEGKLYAYKEKPKRIEHQEAFESTLKEL